jgi:hypothetical protein
MPGHAQGAAEGKDWKSFVTFGHPEAASELVGRAATDAEVTSRLLDCEQVREVSEALLVAVPGLARHSAALVEETSLLGRARHEGDREDRRSRRGSRVVSRPGSRAPEFCPAASLASRCVQPKALPPPKTASTCSPAWRC